MNDIKFHVFAFIISIFFAVSLFYIHTVESMNSMLNYKTRTSISQDYLIKVIDYHNELPAFARRPFTNFFITKISEIFSIKKGFSFILINFLFLAVTGYLIYYLSLLITKHKKQSFLNITLFFLSFTILFAFFPPIFTYDEPIQYFFIVLSIISLVNKNFVLYIIFFSLGIISRENSLLLLPGLYFINKKTSNVFIDKIKTFSFLSLPILIYIIYLLIYFKYTNTLDSTLHTFSDRLTPFKDNFIEQDIAITSIVSFFIVISLPLYFTYVYLNNNKLNNKINNEFMNAFLITLFINTVIVFITTKARESRLFSLPLLFLWPIYSILIISEIKKLFSFRLLINTFKNWKRITIYIIFIFINYVISYKVYLPDYNKLFIDNYFHEYLL